MKDDLSSALLALETAAQTFANAYADYHAKVRIVIDSAKTENKKVTLNAHLGPDRVNDALVRRLRALGVGGVLERGRVPGRLDASWITELHSRVNALV